MIKDISIELEVLNGVPLFVDHIKQDAFLKDPRHQVPYEKAVQAIDRLSMKCEEIVTDTLFRYEVPKANRLTFWQKDRLIKMAENGSPAYAIAQSFGVSEEAVMKAVGEIILRFEREQERQRCLRLAEHYTREAEKLDKRL